LREVCDRRSARVVTIGAGDLSLRGVPHENRSWSEETEINDIASFDVGIMPLEETPWERGKCGFKLIQYMGCGKPVVASPVGVNAEIVEDGVNGFHATSGDEWVASLIRLCNNHAAAKEMGKQGRKRVKETFCLEATVPEWIRLLMSISS
jgi:glycosyltransferase involved in cell wall biosynthesis